MEQAIEISKTAFLARINNRARRFAVDTRYEKRDGRDVLVILYNDGTEKEFRGLDND